MALPIDRELVYEITVPALTTKEKPRVETTYFNPGEVVNIEVVIPPGVAGLAGIRISSNGVQLFPINTGAWLVGDGESIKRDVYNFPNSGRLEIEGYNTDINAHTFTVRYGVRENPAILPASTSPTAPIPTTALGEAPTGTVPGQPPLPTEGIPPTEAPPVSVPPEEPPTSGPPETIPQPPPEAPPEPPAPTPGEPPHEPEAPPSPPAEPPPPSGPIAEAPPSEAPPSAEAEPSAEPAPGAAPAAPARGRKPSTGTTTTTRTVVTHETRPAGGWLPHGARYDKRRTDQGQDLITNWRGPIIAPGDGYVVHNLSDKAFPSGFGPRYAVVKITTGRFAGRDWYVGHCTSVVSNGEHFKEGHTLAHADQGNVEGGGWAEIGLAPGGYPGPMGTGAQFAHLFGTVTITRTHKVIVRVPVRKKPSGKPRQHPGKKAPARKPSGHKPRAPSHGRKPHAGTPHGEARKPYARTPAARGRPPAAAPRRAYTPPRAAPPRRAPAPSRAAPSRGAAPRSAPAPGRSAPAPPPRRSAPRKHK